MTALKQTLVTLIIICLFSALFTSCKKGPSDDPNESSTKSTSFQPITPNSTWTYASDNSAPDTSVMTATSSTQTFNGKAYTVMQFKSKHGSGNRYYYNANHVYNFRIPSNDTGTVDFTYFNDTAKVNYVWEAPFSDDGTLAGFSALTIGKIAEKGISKTVAGKNYTDVTHTILYLQVFYYSNFTTYDFYIAKGVGIIELDSTPLSGTTTSLKLLSYHIN